MKKLLLVISLSIVLISCSKSEECWCNAGDGEYKYYPSYSSTTGYGQSGDLEQECEIEDRSLKENVGTSSYCEMR